MPSAFVTGIGGFLGPYLAARLVARGFEVTGLTRRSPTTVRNVPPGVRLVQGDLLEDGSWQDGLRDAELVIHAAATTGKARPETHVRVNVDGTTRLLTAARRYGIDRFVFVSSIAATFRYLERYHYAQSKIRAEAVVRDSGIPATIVRPTIIVGPESPVLEGLRRLATLPVIPIFGDGTARVQPVFVEDAAEAIAALAIERPRRDGSVELGGPEVLSIEKLLLAIARRLGRSHPRTVHLPLALVLPLLAAGETIAYGAMPVTVGQLATFRCDGIAGDDVLASLHWPPVGIDAMLERSL